MTNKSGVGANELEKSRASVREFAELFKSLTVNEQHEVMGIMIGMNLVRNKSPEQT